MSEEKIIRINKVLREFNISLERAVDFLKDKGCIIEPNPNTKISEKEFNILQNQFGGTKGKRHVFNKVSEEKRKEKEALRIEREREIEDKRMRDEDRLKNQEVTKAKDNTSFPVHFNTIKLDQFDNLPKDIYDDILLYLNSLQNNLLELSIELKTATNDKIVLQQKILISSFKGGFNKLRKIADSLSLRWYGQKYILKIENLEVNPTCRFRLV